jgi:hypothetical protein
MSTTIQHSPTNDSPTKAKNIQIRRVQLTDPMQMPNDLSTTPGGTLFSTTPGGTRIVYDRTFLLECRNSPLAKSPPVGLPAIPGVTCVALTPPGAAKNGHYQQHPHPHPHHPPAHHHPQHGAGVVAHQQQPAGAGHKQPPVAAGDEHEPQFEMDI